MSGRQANPDTDRGRLRHRRTFFRIGAAVATLTIAAGATFAWLAYCADQVRDNLEASLQSVPDLQEALVNGNASGAQIAFDDMRDHAELAHEAATDPVWKAAAHIPLIGENFSAVTEVAVSAHDVVDRAVGPLLTQYESVDWKNVTPIDGRVDLAPIESAAPRLATAANTVQLSYERLNEIDRSNLIEQVSESLAQAIEALDAMRGALNGASSAASLLPDMLGADGRRSYLVLIQNSAEVRATGGIPGALAVVSADEGRIDLTAQASASSLRPFDPAVVVDPEQSSIFSSRIGRFMQSVNLTPNFPTAAHTAATMWEIRNEKSSIDGVIALDPVALSHILRATGPVELSFEDPMVDELLALSGLPKSLTSENVVPTLLSDVYSAIEEPNLQDAYFAAVAAEIFESLSSGVEDKGVLIKSLIRSAEEGRLYVWSQHENEQKTIRSTSLSGEVSGVGSGGAAFGAYFNDGTGAKMDYYVRRTVQLERTCTSDGYLQYTLTATLTNTAPKDAAESLPAYVTGDGVFGVPPGSIQTNFVGYGPDQSRLQTARINGESVPLGSYRHGERPVGIVTTTLAPGQSTTVELDFTNVVQTSEPVLDVTPTIQPMNEVVLPLQGHTVCDELTTKRITSS